MPYISINTGGRNLSDREQTVQPIERQFGLIGVIAIVQLLVLIVILYLQLVPRNTETKRLNDDIARLTQAIDSLDTKIEHDTLKFVTLHETIRTYEKSKGTIEQTVLVLPPDKLAKMFRDSVTKYGRRKE